MAINKGKVNKFMQEGEELDKKEEQEKEKSKKVVNNITGGRKTKVIKYGNGNQRVVKVSESRKTLCVYIPESLYEQFDAITEITKKSKNSTIVELIRNYVEEMNGNLE